MTEMLTLVLTELECAAEDDGHCFLRRDELHARMTAQIDAAIVDASRAGRVVVRGGPVADLPTERIYLRELDEAEQDVATRIAEMLLQEKARG